MGSRCYYRSKRVNVVGDRLSGLPDDLIHKIFFFIDIKHAIKTSALSSRWRYIWTSMPCLNFSNKDFHTFAKFSRFVKCVMSGRNNQIEVSSVNLTFHANRSEISKAFVKRILNIVLNCESSHNVQQLNITSPLGKRIKSSLSLFSSQSLKRLTLTGCTYEPTWELLTLTTLNLHRVTFNDDNTTDKCSGLFSNFANLKSLTLKNCGIVGGLNGFNICHPRLSNLTLEHGYEGGNVVTPQLKNLTIRHWQNMLMISEPNLASLYYKDYCFALLQSGDYLHLEKVDICISYPSENKATASKIVCLLQELGSVKFLTLSLEVIKLLSSSPELISHQPSPFANLKSLKIYPIYFTPKEQTQPKVTMSTEVKKYLLDGSPSATFTMVSHEEIRTVMNVTSARNLMTELHVLLDQWKENNEIKTTHLMQDKAPMKSHMETAPEQVEVDTKMKWHFWERMTHINKQFKNGYKNTDHTISMMREIERILTKLPTSHQDRAKLQVSFSSLCAEAETSMGFMVDHFKIQCVRSQDSVMNLLPHHNRLVDRL